VPESDIWIIGGPDRRWAPWGLFWLGPVQFFYLGQLVAIGADNSLGNYSRYASRDESVRLYKLYSFRRAMKHCLSNVADAALRPTQTVSSKKI
tara:strand:+ start:105 stop:383 length:279 start_codon:yes stop_codon:yes gene_type:complete